MNVGKAKNVIIILLCILVVYQTFGLWFEDISGRNFFYTFFPYQAPVSAFIDEYDFTIPENITIGFGNKSFNNFFMEQDGNNLNEKIEECVRYMAQNGEYVNISEINWNEFLSLKGIICSYSFDMPMDSYMKTMGAKNSQSFSSKQKSFDILAIVPARSSGEYLKMYFINTKENTSAIFSFKKNKVNDTLSVAIEDIQKNSNNINYLSTNQSGFNNTFNNNIFLPQATQNDIQYNLIKAYNPYEVYGETSFQRVEEFINPFFDNSLAKWSNIEDGDIYNYTDENVVVRYYPEKRLLEYSDYSVNYANIENTLPIAYRSAIEIMKKDRIISKEDNIYLSSIENKDSVWKFGFDCSSQNFKVMLSNELKAELGINNMIEITVENGKAIGYKRYVCKINSDFDYKDVESSFSTALGMIMQSNNLNKPSIDDMYLAFLVNYEDEYTDLSWVVLSDNKIYVYED